MSLAQLMGSGVDSLTATLLAKHTIVLPAHVGKAGGIAGWAAPTAHAGATNTSLVGLPASQTNSSWVLPIYGLAVGDVIKAFTINAQIESAGNTATLLCTLRSTVLAAADPTHSTIQASALTSVTADTVVAQRTALATHKIIVGAEGLSFLIEGTTAASTDIQLLNVVVEIETCGNLS